MRELVGRLTALDPAASESLKVVAYFDALVGHGVGLDGVLRGAAALSGVIAGAEAPDGRIIRYDPAGLRVSGEPPSERTSAPVDDGGTVWIEREDAPHANDEMIVERLALAVDLIQARRRPAAGLEAVIDQERTAGERATGLARLRIEPGARVRLVATVADPRRPAAPAADVPTRWGILRATLDTGDGTPASGRAGIGPWVRADHAPESWEGAIIAYRLANAAVPVVDAADLGAMLILARAYDPDHPHEDVRALAALDRRSAEILRVLVESDSLRSAAAKLGMHHSTVQARHESLTRRLGYDPRTTLGCMRYVAAELLLRLEDPA